MNSKIDILIKQHCPNGVEKVKLGEVCTCITGGDTPEDCVKGQKEPSKEYPYPVYANGDETYGYASHYRIDKPAVTISSIGNVGTAYYREPYFIPVIRLKTFIPNDDSLNVKFLYFCLTVMDFIGTNSSLSSMKAADFKKKEIPLPPLAIQQEIVNILDKFTSLIDKIDEEINLRQKQYEYYREKLLTFEDGECEWKVLGDIGEVKMCKRIMKHQTSSDGDIPFYKIGTFGKEPDAYISQKTFDEYTAKYNYPKKGEILISAAGTIGRSVVFDGKPAYFQDSNIVWISNDLTQVTNEYLRYFYTVAKWQIDNGGVVSRLYNDKLKATPIPIPSKSQQHTIVQTLDKFETLISQLKEERALRQKQYEYYREKLLTF